MCGVVGEDVIEIDRLGSAMDEGFGGLNRM